jgi:tetratricopeptide (TPR) repeat protein
LIADAPPAGWGERAGSGSDTGPARGREHVASARFVLGLARFQAADRRGARRELEAALRADSLHAGAARALARVLMGGGEPAAALAWLEHAARIEPPGHHAALERAVALEGLGRHAEARRALDRALAAACRAPLGCGYRGASGSARADDAGSADSALKDHADRRCRMAMRLAELRPAEAVIHLEAALALNPRYVRARLALGLLELGRRRFHEASAELEAARELEPSYLDVRDWLGLARLLGGNARGAVATLEAVVERRGGFARAQRHLSLAYHAVGETASALRAARTGVTVDLDLHESMAGGWPGFEGERARDGELLRALAIRPMSPDLHLALGRIHREAGDDIEARREFRTALTLKPGYPEAALELAGAELVLGRPLEAERRLTDLVGWRPAWVDAQASLGRVRLSRGDAAGAVLPLRAALRGRPDLEPARSDLACAIERLRRRRVKPRTIQ